MIGSTKDREREREKEGHTIQNGKDHLLDVLASLVLLNAGSTTFLILPSALIQLHDSTFLHKVNDCARMRSWDRQLQSQHHQHHDKGPAIQITAPFSMTKDNRACESRRTHEKAVAFWVINNFVQAYQVGMIDFLHHCHLFHQGVRILTKFAEGRSIVDLHCL